MPLHTQLMNLKESTFPDEVLNRIYLESCIYFHYIFPHSNTSPFADHRVFAELAIPHAENTEGMIITAPSGTVVYALCSAHGTSSPPVLSEIRITATSQPIQAAGIYTRPLFPVAFTVLIICSYPSREKNVFFILHQKISNFLICRILLRAY